MARKKKIGGLSGRECQRCHQTGNVEHDSPTALCNLCVDAIQGGADSNRFDPSERAPKAPSRSALIRSCMDDEGMSRAEAVAWVDFYHFDSEASR